MIFFSICNFFRIRSSISISVLSISLSAFRSPSAGKLLMYKVEDGGHVFAGEPYAEMEVMKMNLSLRVPESGW